MAVLNETARALSNLRGNSGNYGSHLTSSLGIGQDGIPVGEELFDAGLYEVSDIDPLSLTSYALGGDFNFVNQEIPFKSMDMRVVVESGSNKPKMDWLSPAEKAKAEAARSFMDTLHNVKNPEDLLSLYVVGFDVDEEAYGPRAIYEQAENPDERANIVADICRRGLNVVISSFELPISGARHDFSNTLGIKINHERELRLLAKTGIWSMGGLGDVDTNKPKQLSYANDRLDAKHAAIAERLQNAGIQVVQVVTNGNGIDWQEYDTSIAEAVEKLN